MTCNLCEAIECESSENGVVCTKPSLVVSDSGDEEPVRDIVRLDPRLGRVEVDDCIGLDIVGIS